MAFAFNKVWQFGIVFTLCLQRKENQNESKENQLERVLYPGEGSWNGQLVVSRARLRAEKLKFVWYVVSFWYIEKRIASFRKKPENGKCFWF